MMFRMNNTSNTHWNYISPTTCVFYIAQSVILYSVLQRRGAARRVFKFRRIKRRHGAVLYFGEWARVRRTVGQRKRGGIGIFYYSVLRWPWLGPRRTRTSPTKSGHVTPRKGFVKYKSGRERKHYSTSSE